MDGEECCLPGQGLVALGARDKGKCSINGIGLDWIDGGWVEGRIIFDPWVIG